MLARLNPRIALGTAAAAVLVGALAVAACTQEPVPSAGPPSIKPTSAPLPTATPATPASIAAPCPVPDKTVCDTAVAVARAFQQGSVAVAVAAARATSIQCPADTGGPGPFPICSGASGQTRSGYSIGRFGSSGAAFVPLEQFQAFLQTIAGTADSARADYTIAAVGCEGAAPAASALCSQRFAVTINMQREGADAGDIVLAYVRESSGSSPRLVAAYSWASGTAAVDGGVEALGDLWTGQHMVFAFSRWNAAVR